jgi:anaerobic C4-dicarboxylate transporter DcuB
MFDFWIQFALVLTAILIGIRRGGVALGLIGGLGVAVLTFGFRVAPSEPPITVMLIILAVVTASATLQVAGGLDFLVQQAERLMRKHPQQITLLAPLSTFLLTVCVGTGHAVYSLLPVIADVALKTKIRPERPMAIASVASQMGITASPVAAAVTTFLAMTAKTGTPVTLGQILMVTLPAGLIGVIAAALWSMRRGLDLDKDPEFLERMKDPAFRASVEMSVTTLDKQLPRAAKLSVIIFFSGILTIVALALFPHLLPLVKGKPMPMTTVVQGGDAGLRCLHSLRRQRQGRCHRQVRGIHCRHDCRRLDFRYCLDERYLRQGQRNLPRRQHQGDGRVRPMDLCHCHVCRLGLRQEPGRHTDPSCCPLVWRLACRHSCCSA